MRQDHPYRVLRLVTEVFFEDIFQEFENSYAESWCERPVRLQHVPYLGPLYGLAAAGGDEWRHALRELYEYIRIERFEIAENDALREGSFERLVRPGSRHPLIECQDREIRSAPRSEERRVAERGRGRW